MNHFDPQLVFLDHTVSGPCVPIYVFFSKDNQLDDLGLSAAQQAWLSLQTFQGKEGEVVLVPDAEGALGCVLLGGGDDSDRFSCSIVGGLPGKLPPGPYEFSGALTGQFDAALFWGLGAYRFDRYKSGDEKERPLLKLSEEVDQEALYNILSAVYLGRDLINTPANDLGPDLYEAEIEAFAAAHDAKMSVVTGEALLSDNFPLVHAVGRAAAQEPRLIDLRWAPDVKGGDHSSLPQVTLVGKGICFDTGGLNLKPGNAMNLMKKDMGGSATALSVAAMVMGANLPIALRVLLPIAENNISGNAFRPGDVLPSRKGLTVEIDNTDAEGRLVLADALAFADEEPVDLLLCFATLTGAARVGLGPDLPPFYTDCDQFAARLDEASQLVADPLWRMPFWDRYDQWLNSKIADVNHVSNGPFAGSITAALFLRRFVERAACFAHFDIYGWTPSELPGKPFGGEPQTARAVFAYLAETYGV